MCTNVVRGRDSTRTAPRPSLRCYTNHNVHVVRKESRKVKLAVIGGDGIGPEVTAEALKVLNTVRNDIETTDYDLGARRYLKNGELLTDADLASLREHDAILLGPSVRQAMCRLVCSNVVFC